MKYPTSLQDLIDSFMLLPGVGPKSAERMAYYVLLNLNKDQVTKFSENIIKAYSTVKKCPICGNLTDKDICDICADETRVPTIMVVESSKDINAFEKTKQYNGKYHVLNGLISPMNGINPNDINLNSLFDRIENEKIEKIIIATSATISGEMTAMYIKNVLVEKKVEVYRIGYGLPAGGDIEYADDVTLLKSLEGIKKI